jgi:hypothetical protein
VFLFPSWVLDGKLKYILACLGTFIAGALIHALSSWRNEWSRRPVVPGHAWSRSLLQVGLYFVQIVLSYLLMLVAMTYNTELFFAVCSGLTAGFAYFNCLTGWTSRGKYTQITSSPEPCCALGDDSAEVFGGALETSDVSRPRLLNDYDSISISRSKSNSSSKL